MAYDIKNLNVASLDFDNIKSSLIQFLENQTDLKDLDYRNEASAVNMLLNILATVTAYNGVYAQYGFTNSFATTATVLESLLGIASNNSVLLAPTISAKTNRTINATGATLNEYSTFNAKATNGADTLFFNIEEIPNNTSKSINLYSGSQVVNYTGYDYESQSCQLPYTSNPETISFYETDVITGTVTKWTRVDKSNTTAKSNNTHFTVINGPLGYIVTNNFVSSRKITTASKVLIKTVISNGSLGNSSTIIARSNTSFGTTGEPSGGYDLISLAQAKSQLLFKATSQDRCVTLNDYKTAILNSGISGTNDISNIIVSNSSFPGQIKIYVTGLSTTESEQLTTYISERAPAGITVVYSL